PDGRRDTIADGLAAGATPARATLAFAAWMRHVWTQRADDGRPFPVDDPMGDGFRARLPGAGVDGETVSAGQAGRVAEALLGVGEVFGDLAESAVFRELVTEQLSRLARAGPRRTAAALLAEA